MIDVNVIVYLDDILVYSDDLAEHKCHVREVLWRLSANGLFTHAQINANFTSPPANTLDICYLLMALRWPKTKSKLSKIGQNRARSRTSNPS